MTIDNNFLELISHDDKLNKEQLNILGINPDANNWKEQALDKEISRNDANLLMLLKGKLALTAQKQIIKNYHTVLDFNNIKAKNVHQIKEVTKKETPLEQKPDIDEKHEYVRIYCDGACSGNPGKAGSGLAIYSNDKKPVLLHGKYEEMGTNNTAELNALFQALTLANQTHSENIISIFSDSKYSIDCIATWAYGWKAKGWTKKGGEIKNLELIKSAHELYEKIKDRIEVKHVKGHAGIEGNELADRMAVHAIKAKNDSFEFFSYDKIDDVLSLKSY